MKSRNKKEGIAIIGMSCRFPGANNPQEFWDLISTGQSKFSSIPSDRQEKFDFIAYVPPTSSGDLVKNFATKLSQVLKFPITHDLVKTRQTKEQKVFENGYLKSDNVSGAFSFNNNVSASGACS